MYTIFIPKYQGEKTEYLITKVIERYMKNSSCNCIISSPGYMGTTSNTIIKFLDELGKKMSGKNPCIGFFNGMNGSRSLGGKLLPDSKSTIREEYEWRVKSPLKSLHICCRPITDHRKMMFFINYNGSMPSILNKNNYKNFLDKCTVCGVLIGSSNQSLGTYFGGRNFDPAEKGEADVLMYTDDSGQITESLTNFQKTYVYTDDRSQITDEITDSQNYYKHRNIRISKSINEENYDDDNDKMFFKDILRNFLENNLT